MIETTFSCRVITNVNGDVCLLVAAGNWTVDALRIDIPGDTERARQERAEWCRNQPKAAA
jgi:hypothetical protein